MSKHEVSQVIGALIFLYLFALLFIARYLKAKHEEVWESIGRPSLLNWSVSSSFKLGWYVFFRGAFKRLNDRRLAYAIYGVRVLAIVIAGVIIWWKLTYSTS